MFALNPVPSPRFIRSLRVLLVDDDADNREMYALFLTHLAVRVMQAAAGTEALDHLTAEPPDVVIADIAMPGVDGIELCRRIKQRDQQTALILLTGLNLTPSDVERVIAAGADSLLLKPCLPETLLQEIQQVLTCPPALRQPSREARIRACVDGRHHVLERRCRDRRGYGFPAKTPLSTG